MKALILVAGNSRRMGDITKELHKTLLPVQGRPILDRMLRALKKANINDVIFVGGFRQDQIDTYVRDHFPELEITWVFNPIFGETNTAYSVFLTRDTVLPLKDDILLINGDVVLDSRCILATTEADGDTVLAVRFDRCSEEEVKVRLNEKQVITEIGKHIPPVEAAGESVGVNRLSKDLLPALYETLEERINSGNGAREFYEAGFNYMIQKGNKFQVVDISHVPVMEIDTPEDYREVEEKFGKNLLDD